MYGTIDVTEFIQLNLTVSSVDKDGFSDPAPQCSAQSMKVKHCAKQPTEEIFHTVSNVVCVNVFFW